VNFYYALGLVAVVAVVAVLAGVALAYRRRINRRAASLHELLELADKVEADLKTCRAGLQQAHAVMSLNPDLPASSEQEARHAIDAGLRSLLQQRIWIRDRAPKASQDELDQVVSTMNDTRDRLRPLLTALDRAQHDLDSAMREHLRREHDA
jgi:Tfp pilus assembly protein PilE